MARFRNVSGSNLAVYRPAGQPGSLHVPAGEILEVAGDARDHGDAYLVGAGGDARLYPKALWDLVRAPQTTTSTKGTDKAGRSESKESAKE